MGGEDPVQVGGHDLAAPYWGDRLTLSSRVRCHAWSDVGTDAGTIVVVEDDPNIADLVDLYLRREGFRVVQAADGEAGLAAIDRERPRLAILDVGLPGGIDGLEVCRRVRATHGGRLPVLDAHRPRRRDRPGPRPGAGRRRLRDQALLAPRAGRPGQGHPAPGRRAAPRPARRSLVGRRRRGRHRPAGGPRRTARWCRWPPGSSTCCSSWPTTPGWP